MDNEKEPDWRQAIADSHSLRCSDKLEKCKLFNFISICKYAQLIAIKLFEEYYKISREHAVVGVRDHINTYVGDVTVKEAAQKILRCVTEINEDDITLQAIDSLRGTLQDLNL